MKKILIIGASSAIATATARLFAERGDKLFITCRNPQSLEILTKDLTVRTPDIINGYSVKSTILEVNESQHHKEVIDQAIEELGGLDIVLIAHGTLPNQPACENSAEETLLELETNAISTILLLTDLASRFEAQKSGSIAVISSVAGDRGRQSNYVYGAAKGMVSIFLQGLRNRLSKSEVQVLNIKPGFVDTPMTTDFDKEALWAKPEAIASDIIKAIDNQRDEIYTPFFWRYIMLIIKSLPEVIFKRLSL